MQKIKGQYWNFIKTSETVTDLYIYDDIAAQKSFDWWTGEAGTEVTASDFMQELANVQTLEIRLHINSGGGDVFEAVAIGQAIKDARNSGTKITCQIDGICASAAVNVALSCESVAMAINGYMMIHNPMCALCGYYTESDMDKKGGALAATKRGIMAAYVERTGQSEQEIAKLMDAETWFTAQDAIDAGFADAIIDTPAKIEVSEDIENSMVRLSGALMPTAMFNRAPAALKNMKKTKGEQKMNFKNAQELKSAYPELVAEIENAARTEGGQAERKRMQELDEIAASVSAEMLNKAKYETPTDAKEALFAAAKAGGLVTDTKAGASAVLDALAGDAQTANGVGSVPNAGNAQPLTTEQQNRVSAENRAKKVFDTFKRK